MTKIIPYLWFDKGKAKEAADFYILIFKDAKILSEFAIENTPSGTVTEITIEIKGQKMIFLDVGPEFKFTEAISFMIDCADQNEVDYYWEKLTSDGGSEGQCAWLKDKFGLSWQVVPKQFYELTKKDSSGKVMEEMLKMNKIIIKDLEKVFKENN
ncbi:MAG: VOC family protein [Nanoarchaeota archaeon]|nr:VOC family protein [Nanoarchaeota archaeon]